MESGELPYRNGGLTDFGFLIVSELNRLGMFADISHVSTSVMHDVLDVTEAPVIFSHSSARGVYGHVRNVPDDVLARMVRKKLLNTVKFEILNCNDLVIFLSQKMVVWSWSISMVVM